jgi:hypothetical protein
LCRSVSLARAKRPLRNRFGGSNLISALVNDAHVERIDAGDDAIQKRVRLVVANTYRRV